MSKVQTVKPKAQTASAPAPSRKLSRAEQNQIAAAIKRSKGDGNVKELYKRYYKNGLVKYVDCADEKGFLSANAMSGKDNMQITVVGHEERMLLIARYDNLGKGASGAAIQNMNIILGVNENTGLSL